MKSIAYADIARSAGCNAELDELARLNGQAHWRGHITEADFCETQEAIDERRIELSPAPASKVIGITPPITGNAPKPRRRRGPRAPISRERCRKQANSGWLPPSMAAKFTESERAALSVIACNIQRHGSCTLPNDAIAAIAGVSLSTVHRALTEAILLGYIDRHERPRKGSKSDTNVLMLTRTDAGKEWRLWIRTRQGVKKDTRPILGFNVSTKDHHHHDQRTRMGLHMPGVRSPQRSSSSGSSRPYRHGAA
jgi:hypothetical protein